MPWSSNRTFLVTCTLEGEELGRHLQARPRRAPAVGLPRRPSTGARSPPTPCREALGWDLVPETVVRDDGPFGDGSFQRFVAGRLLPAPLHPGRGPGPPRPAAGDLRLRRRGQQRRPQERALPPRRGRRDLGHRQRPVLPSRAQAAHRHLGVRRRAAAAGALRRAAGAGRRLRRRRGATCSARPRSAPPSAGAPRACSTRVVPRARPRPLPLPLAARLTHTPAMTGPGDAGPRGSAEARAPPPG